MPRLWLLLLAAAASAPQAQIRVDPLPVTVVPGGAEADGCRRQWQTSNAVPARSAPTDASRVLRTIDAMRRVDGNDYTEALTVVLQPGRLHAPQAATLRAVHLERGTTVSLPVAAGQEIVWLGSAGRTDAHMLVDGVVYAATLPAGVERIALPAVEVWVRLVAHGEGRPEAWLNTAQAGMIEREPACR